MIRPAEIQHTARKEGVRDTQIEKDYILSWILTGVAQNKLLSEVLAFKGGTVLKKFYFEEYRYSEDLDFTLLDAGISNDDVKDAFESVFKYIQEEANIALSLFDFGEHETGNINFYINYVGPLGDAGANKQVKVDISKDELLQFEVEKHEMLEKYSDHETCSLKYYSLKEIMVEKMRSLLSRQQPRDFYDLWYLSESEGMEMSDYLLEFEEKTRHKGLNPDNLENRVNQLLPIFKARWTSSMSDQIRNLPPFEQVSRELGRHFRKIFKSRD
jgi:predicted nucleotidyltransferase component of viral defense system